MSVNEDYFVHDYKNQMAPRSQRQMPVFSQVGKGLRGDTTTLEREGQGADTDIVCKYYNNMTGEVDEQWRFNVAELTPKLEYELWRGVRSVEGVYYNVYYIVLTCVQIINNGRNEMWSLVTPYTPISKYTGSTQNIPADYKVENS